MAKTYTGYTQTPANADLDLVQTQITAVAGNDIKRIAGAAGAAAGTGIADDRGALVAGGPAAGTGALRLSGGVNRTYRVAANLTIAGPLAFDFGAVLKPDNGVTITLQGPLIMAALGKVFDTSAGGIIRIDPRAIEEIRPEWWGAVGDNGMDDLVPLQAALDCAMAANDLNGVLTVTLSRRYKITNSLHGFRWAAGVFTYTSWTMKAAARSYIAGKGVEILPTFTDRPALLVQAARTVDLKGIYFRGALANVDPTYEQVLRDTGGAGGTPWWNNGGVGRDSRYSPYSAVAIDPFSNGLPADGGIPGHAAYYTQNIGSGALTLEKCGAKNFIVAWAVSLSNGSLNGEDITFRDCIEENVKVAYAIGESQNRNVNIINTRGLYSQVMFDCARYGAGNAVFPNVIGGDAAGGCKWLFIGNPGWSFGTMKQFYAESLWSLGFWGWNSTGFPLTLDDCHFSLIPPQVGVPAPAAHLHASGPVIFRGGFCGVYGGVVERSSFHHIGKIVFDQTDLTGEPVPSRFALLDFHRAELHYSLAGPVYGISSRHVETFGTFAPNTDALLAPMGEVLESQSATDYRRWRYREFEHEIVIDAAANITVNADGTATWTSVAAAAKLQVGDHLGARTGTWNAEKYDVTLPVVNYIGPSIGKVKTVNTGTGVIVLEGVPITMVSAVHNVSIRRLPRFRPRTVGITTAASNVVASVNPITMWRVGDRIQGSANIPAGTFITAVNVGGATLTLSQNATGSGTVELYDAKLFLEDAARAAVPATEVYFQGDFIRNIAGTKDASNMILMGWRCTVSGRADAVAPAATFELQYGSAVTPAT